MPASKVLAAHSSNRHAAKLNSIADCAEPQRVGPSPTAPAVQKESARPHVTEAQRQDRQHTSDDLKPPTIQGISLWRAQRRDSLTSGMGPTHRPESASGREGGGPPNRHAAEVPMSLGHVISVTGVAALQTRACRSPKRRQSTVTRPVSRPAHDSRVRTDRYSAARLYMAAHRRRTIHPRWPPTFTQRLRAAGQAPRSRAPVAVMRNYSRSMNRPWRNTKPSGQTSKLTQDSCCDRPGGARFFYRDRGATRGPREFEDR
jgi:hypothetical protein